MVTLDLQRLNIIIVSEGAIDREGNPITAEAVKKVGRATDGVADRGKDKDGQQGQGLQQ